MDLVEIRRVIVTAVASDDVLVDTLVLKGGNALEIVFGIGNRASLDLDYSIEDDFENIDDVSSRLFRALSERFDSPGLIVFDFKFEPRPSVPPVPNQRWGGYTAEFKLIPRKRFVALKGNMDAIRREAQTSGPGQQRKFTIDISKHEYVRGMMQTTVDEYTCNVYTPAMIAVEKLRALCQQMPAYAQRKHPAPRPRDLYDIHAVVVQAQVDLGAPQQVDLLVHMFAAKDVPLRLLSDFEMQREFHRQGWPAVTNAVRGPLNDFDFYFDFVAGQVDRLKPFWNV